MNKHTTKQKFITDLKGRSISLVISKWLIDRTPYIFLSNRHTYIEWKELLAGKIGIDSHAICIMGSAGIGFSLNPNKNFRPFDHTSDVDIAIISNYYFELSWHNLRTLGTKLYHLDPTQKASVQDHVSRLIYWGTIATDRILTIFPFGKSWIEALSDMARIQPTEGRCVNIRLYKDFESLRAYQFDNLNKLRQRILSPIGGEKNESLLEHNT